MSAPSVVVAAWAGSSNLGDELVLAGMLVRLRELGVRPVVLSQDPAATRRDTGAEAVDGQRPWEVAAAIRSADAVVLGGGGLLQDASSPWNLQYHLSRLTTARALRTPYAGVGLGAGPLRPAGSRQVRWALRGATGVSVRDEHSARLLAEAGLPSTLAADLALVAPLPAAPPPADVLVVCPRRPVPAGAGRWLPASVRARVASDGEQATARTAAELAEAARRTGLRLRLVALQPDRDGPLGEQLAGRIADAGVEVEVAVPDLAGLFPAIADARAVVSVRYHGALLALRAGVPVVAIGIAPKVTSLAQEMRSAGTALPLPAGGLAGVADAVERLLAAPHARADAAAALAALIEREQGNGVVLEDLLGRVAARR
jgi:polysaccharide pyruvyl transferase CsaB